MIHDVRAAGVRLDRPAGASPMEVVRAAFAEAGGSARAEVSDLMVVGPTAVTGVRETRAVLTGRDDGYAFTVASAPALTAGREWTDHLHGVIRTLPDGDAPVHGLDEIRARCLEFHGDCPDCLLPDEASADIRPLAYGRIALRAALPPRFYSYVRPLDDGRGQIRAFDVTLIDPAGRELVGIDDVAVRTRGHRSIRDIGFDLTAAAWRSFR